MERNTKATYYRPVMVMDNKQKRLTKFEYLYVIASYFLWGMSANYGIDFLWHVIPKVLDALHTINHINELNNLNKIMSIAFIMLIPIILIVVLFKMIQVIISVYTINSTTGWGHLSTLAIFSNNLCSLKETIDQENFVGKIRLKKLILKLQMAISLLLFLLALLLHFKLLTACSAIFIIFSLGFCLLELWKNRVILPLTIKIVAL